MAALIIDSVGAVCTSICTLPCTLCRGVCQGCNGLCHGCGGICKGCTQACGSVCRGCTQGCGNCCAVLSKALCSPFAPYLLVSAILNIPVAVWGFRKAFMDEGSSCRKQTLWLWVNGALALLNMVAAIYIVVRVQSQLGSSSSNNGSSPTTATAVPAGNSENNDNKNSIRSMVQVIGLRGGSESGRTRFRKVLCYDPLVALYMMIGAFWIGWVFYGILTVVGAAAGDCEDSDIIMSSISSALLFVVLACCTIPCAFICLE